ncbi:MAG: hypothetical protein K1X57_05550 [Gemmataceae bacterium]|nr:hypothetical protein [Gemmataceae bacterium]
MAEGLPPTGLTSMIPMSHAAASAFLHLMGGVVAFRIRGRGEGETGWTPIDVFANDRRNAASRWPLWRNHCITLTASAVAVGWDFARDVIEEEAQEPTTPVRPVRVTGGRLGDIDRRYRSGGQPWCSCAEILAHECGHTAQARRMGFLYWPLVGSVTLLREGPRWFHRLENEASEFGEFGGIIPGTIHPRLLS